MNCAELAELWADYLGDELSAVDRATVESHLEACAACRAEFEADRGTLAALTRLQAAPAALAIRQAKRLVVRRPPTLLRMGWIATRTAALLAIGVLAGEALRSPAPKPLAEPQAPTLTRPAAQSALAMSDEPVVHPRWIKLARQCESNGGSSFACQLAVLAETARQ